MNRIKRFSINEDNVRFDWHLISEIGHDLNNANKAVNNATINANGLKGKNTKFDNFLIKLNKLNEALDELSSYYRDNEDSFT